MAFFKDLLKKWFFQNSSQAASSDARIPLLTSTGEPKGSDTMANLASVLKVGSVSYDWLEDDVDFNNCTETFIHRFGNNMHENFPIDSFGFGILIVFKCSSSVIQICWIISNKKLYIRTKWDGAWGNWTSTKFV
jgi:hypothetical protein